MGQASGWLKQLGASKDEIDEVMKRARSGDYLNLKRVIKWALAVYLVELVYLVEGEPVDEL